jgi:polar amino acid transport system substrate-binding protein
MFQKSKSISLFFIVFIFSFSLNQAFSQTEIIPTKKEFIQVGVVGSEPFVFEEGSNKEGISVEIWKEIAAKNNWRSSYKNFDNVESALNAVKNNEVDIAIGPISITSSRLENMKFSQPFYNSSLSIVSRSDQLSFWQKIQPLFSFKLIIAIFIFLFILAIVGTLLWLAERKHSPEQFPNEPLNGIGTGMWLAIVTMTTVGYGDKAPVTLSGRIIAGSWMIISIIFATSMVAGIASTLTLTSLGTSSISKIEEVNNKKIATISGSPAESFIQTYKAKINPVAHLSEAFEKLKNKEIDAVVYDRPQLLYYIKTHDEEELSISKAEYFKQGYGFAFPLNSTMVYDVNKSLLKLAEMQKTTDIIDEYLGKDE